MNFDNIFSKYSEEIKRLKLSKLDKKLNNMHYKNETILFLNKKKYVSFCSNDYFGLSKNEQIKNAGIKAIEKYGIGSTSSRYISGNHFLNEQIEKEISKTKNTEDAIIFGSGYLTAIGTIPALVNRKDLIIADKLIHSSLIDGIKLSGANFFRFSHNNINECKKLLIKYRNHYDNCIIISETVFSMDGTLGKIKDLIDLSIEFNSLLISDDAHGFGLCNYIYPENSIQIGTFSKALGGYGGYACGNKKIINYLRNKSKTAIYSTALPPIILSTNLKALKIFNKNSLKYKNNLLSKVSYFFEYLKNDIKAKTPIVILHFDDITSACSFYKILKKEGFLVVVIRPPTSKTPRIRITFSTYHLKRDIKKLAHIVKSSSLIKNIT